MSRASKIRALTNFFNAKTPVLKPETKVVFKVTANGKLIEPKGMDEQQFEAYVNDLRTQYADVLVWEEGKEYEVL